MSRWERHVTPAECSNPIPGRHRESPDLLTRCVGEKLVDGRIHGVETRDDTDSPANHTDIIISDDDTPSFDSDATIVLEPDIIIDYEGKRTLNESNSLPIAGCSTPKNEQPIQQNVGMIRCKPLKDLLSERIESPPKAQVNDEIENGIDHKKVDLMNTKIRRIAESCLVSPKRFNTQSSDTSSSSSSSSSPIPPTPTPKRLRSRLKKVISSNSEDSDTALVNVVKKKSHRKIKIKIIRANIQSKSAGKLGSYRPLMKEWSMHEATPPTSGSDQSDDNFQVKGQQHLPNKTYSRNEGSSNPGELSARKKFIPKYILDENYRVIKTINSQTDGSKGRKYNTRLTKVNLIDKIQQLSNIKKTIEHPSVSNVVRAHDKLVANKLNKVVNYDEEHVTPPRITRKIDRPNVSNGVNVNDKIIQRKAYKVSSKDKKQVPVSSPPQEVDPRRQWMQRYPNVEAQISKDRDIPTGSSFCEWERIGMIWWLLKTDNIPVARLKKTWAEMQQHGYLKHRSMRSLQNHFLRKILPNLHEFSLPAEILDEFEVIKR